MHTSNNSPSILDWAQPLCKIPANMIHGYFAVLIIGLSLLNSALCSKKCKPQIAIIGGGIGGASASHFLTELFDENLEIDLYEGKSIGGRLALEEFDGMSYEAGGSVIHSANLYMQEFVKLLGMERTSPSLEKYGIWNGNEFAFESSSWDVVTLAKLFYRYGFQPFQLRQYIGSIFNDFSKIYNMQRAGKYFTNVTSMLAAMSNEFPRMMHTTIKNKLSKMGYGNSIIDEMVKATMVVNYGQDVDVQSFVGFVSLATLDGSLWSVKGGNKEVPEHLIYRNKHVHVTPFYVKKIRYIPTDDGVPQYELYYGDDDANLMTSLYDLVVIATPLTRDQKTSITFEGFPKNLKFNGEYHTTVVMFVKGDINPQYFGLDGSIDAILSCNPEKTQFNSVGKLNPVSGNTRDRSRIWKIFSREPLKAEIIHNMFTHIDEVRRIVWKAYPEYSTDIRLDEFKLHDGLYHVNAIEWAASAMEMSAIGAKNVALLAYNEFSKNCTSTFDKEAMKRIPENEHTEL